MMFKCPENIEVTCQPSNVLHKYLPRHSKLNYHFVYFINQRHLMQSGSFSPIELKHQVRKHSYTFRLLSDPAHIFWRLYAEHVHDRSLGAATAH